jgi:hypothetical protein
MWGQVFDSLIAGLPRHAFGEGGFAQILLPKYLRISDVTNVAAFPALHIQ